MWIRTTLKWLGIVVGSVIGLVLLAVATIYVYMGSYFETTFDVVGTEVSVPEDEASIANGGRLAKLRGCNGGCHGEGSRGQVMFELPGGSGVVAPNVVRAAQNYPIEDLERLVRHGVRPDGTSVLLLMPSAMLYHLTDDDFGAIVAFLRSLDPGSEELPVTNLNVIGRMMMFYYKQLADNLLSAEFVDHDAARINPVGPVAEARGHYLAKSVCSECHGQDLRGTPAFEIPDLVVASAYPLEDFRILMRTGVPSDGRELSTMASVAESRFAYFTDDEIDDLHAFLQTLASIPVER